MKKLGLPTQHPERHFWQETVRNGQKINLNTYATPILGICHVWLRHTSTPHFYLFIVLHLCYLLISLSLCYIASRNPMVAHKPNNSFNI